jgi:cytochrome c biogenesis protein CcmG/thiol:disulfide interchange protein DsbE
LPSTPSSAPLEARRRWVVPTAAALAIGLVAAITIWVSADDSSPGAVDACAARVEPTGASVTVGRDLPNLRLPALDGGCILVSSYRGRPLVVNFWASWCHPCRTEFPLLEDARERYEDDRLEVIGITYHDIASDSRRFAEERDAAWPLAVDDDDVVADAFGVRTVPETFFIASDGTVVSHVFGFTSARDLDDEIQLLLKR